MAVVHLPHQRHERLAVLNDLPDRRALENFYLALQRRLLLIAGGSGGLRLEIGEPLVLGGNLVHESYKRREGVLAAGTVKARLPVRS